MIPLACDITQCGDVLETIIPKVVEQKIIVIKPGVGTQVPSRKE